MVQVVVLQHMFTLDELEEDPSLFLDLKEDLRGMCDSGGCRECYSWGA